jgi:hypothetical protein
MAEWPKFEWDKDKVGKMKLKYGPCYAKILPEEDHEWAWTNYFVEAFWIAYAWFVHRESGCESNRCASRYQTYVEHTAVWYMTTVAKLTKKMKKKAELGVAVARPNPYAGLGPDLREDDEIEDVDDDDDDTSSTDNEEYY